MNYRDEIPEIRYRRWPDEDVTCDRCGRSSITTVSEDALAGVACFRCPHCGAISEA